MSDLRARYEARRPALEEAAARLQAELRDHLADRPHIDRVSFRAKGTDSFVKKAAETRADEPYVAPLEEIEDQVAGRVLVLFKADVPRTLKHIAELFNAVEQEHKRPSRYNEFDYESVHAIFALPPPYLPSAWSEHGEMPRTFEMQVRTLLQHAYSEPQHDLGYKPDTNLDDEARRQLAWIAASCWGADEAFERVRMKLRQASPK